MDVPVPAALKGPRVRPWIRRTAWILVAGGVVVAGVGWGLRRPAVERMILRKVDTIVRQELGVGLEARHLRLEPFRGRVVLEDFALGGDLLRGDVLEVTVDLRSLLGSRPHVYGIRLEGARALVDRERLSRIRLRERPPSTSKVRVDHVEVRRASAQLLEPMAGLPAGRAEFWLRATGTAPEAWDLELGVPGLTVIPPGPGRPLAGLARIRGHAERSLVSVKEGLLRLGEGHVAFQGRLEPKEGRMAVQASGTLDLAQGARLAGIAPAKGPEGRLDFQARAAGPLKTPVWEVGLEGRDLRSPALPLHPGHLEARAAGSPGSLQVHAFRWSGTDGEVEARGGWTRKEGTRLSVEARNLSLAPAAELARAPFLRPLTARFNGELILPGAPWQADGLDRATFVGSGAFRSPDGEAGAFEAVLGDGRLSLSSLELRTEALAFQGRGTATLGRHGLAELDARGEVLTDAADVAEALSAWHLVDLDMAGETRAEAQVSWSREAGLRLEGEVDVLSPRYVGARADHIQAKVGIHDDQLEVRDIQLERGEGRGSGELWLTWADVPEGARQIDMCYRACRLPIREGLHAVHLEARKDRPEGVLDLPIDGTASGWVRLQGPFHRIGMEGSVVAQDASVFGVAVPAASGDFTMDIGALRLGVRDLRVAEDLGRLSGPEGPTGFLALRGALDMDLERGTWDGRLGGQVDTSLLGLKGPRFQSQADVRLQGPLTVPFGPWEAPGGTLAFRGGRLFVGSQSLEGLEGSLSFQDGALSLRAGIQGKPRPVVRLDAIQQEKRLVGDLALAVTPESAETAHLAARLFQDFVRDLRLETRLSGTLGEAGLDWSGTLDAFSASFEGFGLAQSTPGKLSGDLSGIAMDLALEGRALGGQGGHAARLGLKGRLPFQSDRPMALHLGGNAELADLKALVDHLVEPGQYSLLADMRPEGSATVDLDLEGTPAQPGLEGTLRLARGKLRVAGLPQGADDVDFTLRFKDRDILIPESDPLRGTVALGALKAFGKATWRRDGFLAYDLRARLDGFQLRDTPEGFELQGSLEVAAKGNDQDGGTIKGDLWARRMVYRADINLTDLILAGALGGGASLSGLDPDDPLAKIYLDLNLHLDRPWEFDTNLLKLQGRPVGTFKVLGTLARQGLKGRMAFLPGGRLTNLLPAGDVVLERGSIEFADPGAFNPILDLRGRIDVNPFLVGLDISGTLDALQFRPSSTPSLRQDEIVAILIDPGLAQTIGSTSTATSQSALTNGLASTGTGVLSTLMLANFQEMVRKAFTLDRVNVAWRPGATSGMETTLTLGKTVDILGHRTPIVATYKRGASEASLKGQIEWRFGNLVLQLGASQEGPTLGLTGEIRHTWSPP